MRIKSLILATAAAGLSLTAASANAATNLGFETGNLSGWTLSGSGGAAHSYGAFTAVEGADLAYIVAGQQGIYSTLTQIFALAAGQTITGSVGFQSNDYLPYNDDAYLAINGLHLFDSSVAQVGSYGSSGWKTFSYTAAAAGNYALTLGVRNIGDSDSASGAVLDKVSLSAAVPEPATWAMMLMGFAATGVLLRSDRRRAVALA
jgi:uncharacterized protein YraI